MIVTLAGTNSLTLRRRLAEIRSEFIKQYGELAVERIDCEEAELAQIIEALQSLPFLTARKLVILRNLSANKLAHEAIEQIIDSVSDSTELVIVEPSPDKRQTVYKTLSQKTKMEQFDEPGSGSVAQWAIEEAKNHGAQLSLADAEYLVDRLGPNQQLVASEIAKLAIYNPKITRKVIELMVEASPQSRIFDLLDAAFSGNKDKTMLIYDDQRKQRVEPQAILAMIAWQLKALTAISLAGGKNSAQISKDFGLSPFVVGKTLRLASRINPKKLQQLVDEAVEIDYKSKTVAYDIDEAVKNYLVTI